jgi:chemotaxis regulatin CheY-phosphate phosphatase CheZ
MTQAPMNTSPSEKSEVDDKLDDLERFIARRFDEISMEIEATSQLMEMAEEDAGKRFQDMLGMLSAISAVGDGSSPANSGLELKAVVAETEQAATTIMDAADKIKTALDTHDDDLTSDMHLAPMAETIHEQVQSIILACGFQDLVSQRVTTSLKNIKNIEERLSSTLSKFGIKIPTPEENAASNDKTVVDDLASQGDIDALFD